MPVPSAALLSQFSFTLNGSSFTANTGAPSANQLALGWFLHRGTTLRSISSLVGAGAQNGWTSVISVTFDTLAAPGERLEVWRAMSATPTADSVLTITTSGSVSNMQGGVVTFSNVTTTGTNGANAVVQSVSSRADTVSVLTCTLASFASTVNVPFGTFSWATTVRTAITPGASFVELGEAGALENGELNSQWTSANTQKVPATLTAGTRNCAGIALEIAGDNAATGGQDVLLRVGNVSTTEHSGLITSDFSAIPPLSGFYYFRRLEEYRA